MKRYESTHLHSSVNRRRTAAHPGGIALALSVCASALPDRASLRPRRACHSHSQDVGLRRPNGAQCDYRVQRAWTRGTHPRILSSPPVANAPTRRRVSGAASTFTSQSTRLRDRAQPVEFIRSSQDLLRARADLCAYFWGLCASHAGPARDQLETSQALDHQPRSAVRGKKTRAIA